MKISSLFFVLTLVWNTATAQADIQQRFLEDLNRKSTSVESICCDFIQTKHNSMLAQDARSEGVFYFKRPSRLALLYTGHNHDRIVMGEIDFMVVAGGTAHTVKIASNPLYQQMQEVFSACFSGDVKALSSGDEFRCQQLNGQYEVRITPSSKRARRYIAELVLVFSKKDMLLDELRIIERSGDYTSYQFRNRKTNQKIENSVFECKL